MSKTHLTLSDRVRIQSGLDKSESFKKIAKDIGKDCTTVSREVRNHSYDVTGLEASGTWTTSRIWSISAWVDSISLSSLLWSECYLPTRNSE